MAHRSALALFLAAAVIVIAASTALAVKPNKGTVPSSNGCVGIANAYAHVAPTARAALQRVADMHGCDLSAVTPAAQPDNADQDDADEPGNSQDQDAEPGDALGPDVVAKCTKINEKLADAATRSHGKSADAFARQATHWGCDPD